MQCVVTEPEELMRTHFYCMSLLNEAKITKVCDRDWIVALVHLEGFMLIVMLVLLVIGLLNTGGTKN